jgi:hypothetical protein
MPWTVCTGSATTMSARAIDKTIRVRFSMGVSYLYVKVYLAN